MKTINRIDGPAHLIAPGLLTFYNGRDILQAHQPEHTPMTNRTAAPAPVVLDFDVFVGKRFSKWAVFDAISGDDLVTGQAETSAGAERAARAAIARRTITVGRTAGGWSLRHPVHGMVVPLPLTPAASEDNARAYVLALPIGAAAGRIVVVMGAL